MSAQSIEKDWSMCVSHQVAASAQGCPVGHGAAAAVWDQKAPLLQYQHGCCLAANLGQAQGGTLDATYYFRVYAQS